MSSSRDLGRQAAETNRNLKQSVSSARSLGFAVAGVSGQMGGMVGASAALAENIAKASRNAKLAASATGIGALVAILGTVVALTVDWGRETKEVADKVRDIKNETARLHAQASNDKRLERELEIQAAMDGELDTAQKMEHWYRKQPALMEAIRQKADAARSALKAEANRAFGDMRFDLARSINPIIPNGNDRLRSYALGQKQLQDQQQERIRELNRSLFAGNAAQVAATMGLIEEEYRSGMRDLQYELEAPSRQFGESLGRSITGSIADGIETAIKAGSFGEGFKALTAGILVGLGGVMEEIGTQSLLAANLLKGVISALMSFAPEGAILPALALIAAGAALKGIGGSIGSSRGGGSRGGGAGGASSYLNGGVMTVSPVAAAGGASSFASGGPNFNYFTVIGENDPVAQRTIVTMVDKGNARRGRR